MADSEYQKYICRVCGFIYDEAEGDPDSGLAPGTRFEDIPDDWTCPLCGVSKADMILLDDFQQQAYNTASVTPLDAHLRRAADARKAIVIIGAGIAGWSAAAEIRDHDRETPIVLVCGGAADYYPKPMLSMAYSQQREPDDIVEISGPAKAAELDVILREHTKVVAINRIRKRLLTTRGSIYYDKLILASGARQAELPCHGDALDDVLRINDLDSYRRLREQLQQPGKRVAIIGAGLIGCELAEDLTSGGHEVTLIERGSQPLLQLLPKTVAATLHQQLTERGIRCLMQREVQAIHRVDQGLLIALQDESVVQADVVISAIGLIPNTRLAAAAGLACGRGILVNARDMRSCDLHIYALGDCAQVGQHSYAYIEPIHRQAKTLAAALADEPHPFEPRQPLIRVKTPSLPLVVCPPPQSHGNGHWQLVKADAKGHYMAYLVNGTLLGFALSGNFTQLGHKLYAEVNATLQALSETTPSRQLSA